jgi:hypothetical protein
MQEAENLMHQSRVAQDAGREPGNNILNEQVQHMLSPDNNTQSRNIVKNES